MKVGIIGAMDIEVRALKGMMDNAVTDKVSGMEFYRGRINGTDTVVAVAGVGKVNAAVCTQTMILRHSPDCIVNVGVAGGLSEKLGIGDIAVADAVCEHDMDTTPIGDPKGFISGLNTVYIKTDPRVTDMICAAAKELGLNYERGTIASGDQFISTHEQRTAIKTEFNAIAAEMEGAAIGHAAAMNDVPFAVIRALSDGANEESVDDYPTFAKKAAANSVAIIIKFLEGVK